MEKIGLVRAASRALAPYYVDGTIGNIAQIGSTLYASRRASMNATITSLGGGAPPAQNTPTLCGESHSHAAAYGFRALSGRSHSRRVSGAQPILPAIEVIAVHCAAYFRWCSRTSRTARSLTSGTRRPCLVILQPRSSGSLQQARGDSTCMRVQESIAIR